MYLNDCVQKCDGIEQHRPGVMIGVIQSVLANFCVGPLQASPDALGRLVGELDGHLQQTDGEAGIDFGRQPETEIGVNFLCVDDRLHDFITKVQGQVAILKKQPMSIADGELKCM